MRKRIHSLCFMILIILACLTSCEKKTDQLGYAPVFKELTWGMTKEEAIKTLGLTNTNAQVVKSEDNSAYTIIQLKTQVTMFSENAVPHLLITKGEKSEQSKFDYPVNALSAIILQYNDVDTNELTKSMNNILGKPTTLTERDEVKTYIWKSKDKFGKLDSTLRDKVKQYIGGLGNIPETQDAADEYNKAYPKKNSAVNKITMTITDETNATVTYYGDWAVYVHCCSDESLDIEPPKIANE